MNTEPIKILIVEDDEATQVMLESSLQKEGNQIQCCGSAEEAWSKIQTDKPELIFLDINLPGMSGLELCRKIREEPKFDEIYIIAATGKDQPEELQEILQAGANDYMAKPIQPKMVGIRTSIAKFTVKKIEETKSYQVELTASKEKYRMISENGRDSVVTIGPEGEMTYLSPGTENLLGYPIKELLGKKMQSIIHEEDAYNALPHGQEEILNGNLEEITEFRIKTPQGEDLWVEALYSPLQNEDGNEVKEWITYIRESQSIRGAEHQIEILEEILQDQKLSQLEIIERMAMTFNGRGYIIARSQDEEEYEVIVGSKEHPIPKNSLFQLLWKGSKSEEKINSAGEVGYHPYVITKGIELLAPPNSEKKSEETWESGMIQPIFQSKDSSDPEIKLVILSKNQIQERDLRTTKAILRLTGCILGIKPSEEST